MSVAQVVRSRPRRSFTSIRRQLLQTRRTLLLQAATWTPPQTEQENPADVLDLASCQREWAFNDLLKQYLRQAAAGRTCVEPHARHLLRHCHRCHTDIPLLRLRAQPDATLCVTCKSQCEERTLLRVGA